ncbi:hypothetical protein DC522_22640 [Microvirga sp. KLBC 81]|nr:hypothetical protein DC522_22640 [Microvirga sp. KLBC 81]
MPRIALLSFHRLRMQNERSNVNLHMHLSAVDFYLVEFEIGQRHPERIVDAPNSKVHIVMQIRLKKYWTGHASKSHTDA